MTRSHLERVRACGSSDPLPRIDAFAVAAAREEAALERRVERRPRGASVGVLADVSRKTMYLRVKVVEVVQGNCLGRHRQSRAAKLVRAVVAQDHVLEP